MSAFEQNETLNQLKDGHLKLLYVAPEKLSADNGSFLKLLNDVNLSYIREKTTLNAFFLCQRIE